jgi:NAD(P)-dependent dehydrogenase (short-subunit alcohol dehydrogenase family)
VIVGNPSSAVNESIAAMFDLSGRAAVVTGGGAGLGLEIALLLARAGAAVVVADIDLDAAEQATKTIAGEGGEARAIRTDVTSEQSILELYAFLDTEFGGIDILVNNAGIYPNRLIEDCTIEDWETVHSLNLRGPFLCMREAVKQMRNHGRGGRIINISSIASVHPALTGNTHYASSKAGLNMLTKALALEVAADGITVNAVLPGGVMTETRKKRMGDAPIWAGPATDGNRFLLGLAPPVKHASPVLFLASPSADHITGQTLVVDGGFLIS